MKREIGKGSKEVRERIKLAAALVLIILGVLDILRVVNIGAYQGSLALIGTAALLITVSALILRKKESRTLRFFCEMVDRKSVV